MHGTHSTIGATLCGVILPTGRDCNGPVPEGAPINLCAAHFRAAYEWQRDRDQTMRTPSTCPVCGLDTFLPGARGATCMQCTYQSDDYRPGPAPSGAEVKHLLQQVETSAPAPAMHPPVVYFIRFGDRIKIGTTTNLRKRLQQLPHDEMLGIERGGVTVESRRHTQFRAHRVTGEWFTADPALVDFAKALNGGLPWQEQIRQMRRPA